MLTDKYLNRLILASAKVVNLAREAVENWQCDCQDGHTCGRNDRIREIKEYDRIVDEIKRNGK